MITRDNLLVLSPSSLSAPLPTPLPYLICSCQENLDVLVKGEERVNYYSAQKLLQGLLTLLQKHVIHVIKVANQLLSR